MVTENSMEGRIRIMTLQPVCAQLQVRLNACAKRPMPGEDGVIQMMDIFEDKIEDPDGLGEKVEEPEPLPEGAPPPPPVIKSQGEDDLPFKIPESGVLEFDYVGA